MLKALTFRGKLVTWSDNCYSPNPTLYSNSGFQEVGALNPDYFYTNKKGEPKAKQSAQKKNVGCPPEITEAVFLKSQGYYKIWDCGKIKWVKELT
jgi:hypothetical protein